jgi:hypothetical protein
MPQLAIDCCFLVDIVEPTKPIRMARGGIQVEAELEPYLVLVIDF